MERLPFEILCVIFQIIPAELPKCELVSKRFRLTIQHTWKELYRQLISSVPSDPQLPQEFPDPKFYKAISLVFLRFSDVVISSSQDLIEHLKSRCPIPLQLIKSSAKNRGVKRMYFCSSFLFLTFYLAFDENEPMVINDIKMHEQAVKVEFRYLDNLYNNPYSMLKTYLKFSNSSSFDPQKEVRLRAWKCLKPIEDNMKIEELIPIPFRRVNPPTTEHQCTVLNYRTRKLRKMLKKFAISVY